MAAIGVPLDMGCRPLGLMEPLGCPGMCGVGRLDAQTDGPGSDVSLCHVREHRDVQGWLGFLGVLVVEAALPIQVSVPPVWELALTILGTYALTGLIDHDRPLLSVWQLAVAELRVPRRPRHPLTQRIDVTSVRSREGHGHPVSE